MSARALAGEIAHSILLRKDGPTELERVAGLGADTSVSAPSSSVVTLPAVMKYPQGCRRARASMERRRVLFVAEAVTLAHVVRLVSLAGSLDPTQFDCRFAADPRFSPLVGEIPIPSESITSMPAERFQRAISTGAPIFDYPTLVGYAREDLALISRIRPDVVVSDFRISLSASARSAGVPLVTLTNAYWSPFARVRHVVPELDAVALVGARIAQPIFGALHRLGYAAHVRPINRLRRDYDLPPLGSDFREALVDGEATLYSDVPQVIRTVAPPPTHHFIGPVPWSPPVSDPVWLKDLVETRVERPLVYVSLGSSGPRATLQAVLDALSSLPVRAAVAAAGSTEGLRVPSNTRIAEMLSGDRISAVASAVVCNGGSPATYQALAAGVPVVGLATNMDQFLNMAAVQDASCGRLLRSRTSTEDEIRAALMDVLSNPRLREGALRAQRAIGEYDPFALFRQALDDLACDATV